MCDSHPNSHYPSRWTCDSDFHYWLIDSHKFKRSTCCPNKVWPYFLKHLKWLASMLSATNLKIKQMWAEYKTNSSKQQCRVNVLYMYILMIFNNHIIAICWINPVLVPFGAYLHILFWYSMEEFYLFISSLTTNWSRTLRQRNVQHFSGIHILLTGCSIAHMDTSLIVGIIFVSYVIIKFSKYIFQNLYTFIMKEKSFFLTSWQLNSPWIC